MWLDFRIIQIWGARGRIHNTFKQAGGGKGRGSKLRTSIPGTVFTTLPFLRTLWMGPKSYIRLERLASKHSSLLYPFISYEENDVFWIWSLECASATCCPPPLLPLLAWKGLLTCIFSHFYCILFLINILAILANKTK